MMMIMAISTAINKTGNEKILRSQISNFTDNNNDDDDEKNQKRTIIKKINFFPIRYMNNV